ncbi:hypothetical protein D9758_017888 [Tetrapyrgos nigripes]|uniref:Uncharacterized protein n=1 Tax=Tetrapyrgos nigripes TaxID=182062 RepID=A0A8H5FDW2_9AGAR|nr:hypothetical protein D9758_017888 [Tetrapyrgos nigripes]
MYIPTLHTPTPYTHITSHIHAYTPNRTHTNITIGNTTPSYECRSHTMTIRLASLADRGSPYRLDPNGYFIWFSCDGDGDG